MTKQAVAVCEANVSRLEKQAVAVCEANVSWLNGMYDNNEVKF